MQNQGKTTVLPVFPLWRPCEICINNFWPSHSGDIYLSFFQFLGYSLYFQRLQAKVAKEAIIISFTLRRTYSSWRKSRTSFGIVSKVQWIIAFTNKVSKQGLDLQNRAFQKQHICNMTTTMTVLPGGPAKD